MSQPAAASNTGRRHARRTMMCNELSSCPDMEESFVELYERCRPFTMTSLERMYGLYSAVRYICEHQIPGNIVECGVWRGGSCMLAAHALAQTGDTGRKLYLYDTFAGMPEPAEMDVDYDGKHAACRLGDEHKSFDSMARASVDEVRRNLSETGYPQTNLVFVEGRVEQTIPETAPDRIAILRLDTDWYESTRHELEHLYPLLSPGGVLIVDDYGHWKGCRRAVDEYLHQHAIPMMLHRVDYTGRFGIKP